MKNTRVVSTFIFMLIGTFLFAAVNSSSAHGASTGIICIIPTGASSCPPNPASLTGTAGTQFRVSIFIQNSTGLNGFDITLLADHTILKPAGVDLTGTVLPGPQTILLECLSGRLVLGNTCSSTDTIDTLHLAAASAPGTITITPTTGLLFTAIYNVTGTSSGTSLGFQTGCGSLGAPTSDPPICVNVANGTLNPVPETVQPAIFSTSTTPDFSIASSGANIGLAQGASSLVVITLTSQGGFTGTVSLTDSASPAGLALSLNPTSVSLASGGSGSATLTISTTASTPPGSYAVTVTGTSGSISHAISISVIVFSNQPDFTIAANPSFLAFPAGSSATSTINTGAVNGFNSNIFFTITTSSGLTGSISPTSVGPNGKATLTVTAPVVGNYTAIVTGTSGSLSHSATVFVTVTSNAPDFTITANPANLTILPGASGTSTVGLHGVNGFNNTVFLSVTTSNGLTASINPTSTGPFGTATLTVTSNSAGSYTAQVTGTSGTLSHTTTVIVTVSSSGVGVVCIVQSGTTSCPTSPASITGTSGTQLRVSVFIQGSGALNGFDITLLADHTILRPVGIDLAGAVLPAPTSIVSECVGGVIIHGNVCPGNADTLELAAVGVPSQLTFPPTTGLLFTAIYNVTGTTSGIPIGYQTGCSSSSVSGTTTCVDVANGTTSPVPETVQTATFSTGTTPDFAMTASPSSLNINAGSSRTSTITITSVNNFAGTINLIASVSPSGPVATLSVSSVVVPAGGSVTTIITITTTNSTPTGAYFVTVTGTSGVISHSAVVNLNVVSAVISSLAIDGSALRGCSHFTNSCSTLFSTQHGNDIIIIYAFETLDLQTSCTFSVTDTARLAWTARSAVVFGNGGRDQLQEFWARSAGVLASDNVTESISGCASVQYGGEYNGLMIFGITGANFNTPFDPNVALPGCASGNSMGTSVLVSTSNANDMIIGGVLHGGLPVPTAGSGFTIITSAGTVAAEYENVNMVQSNTAVTFGDSLSAPWESIGDAVQPAGAVTPDFSLSASPSSLTLTAGSSATSSITATSVNAFSGTVTLSATTPNGLTSSLNPITLNISPSGSASSTLTIASTASTPPGSYTVTITGTSGTPAHSLTFTVAVTGPQDFTISENPTSQSIPSNSEKQTVITVTSVNGFSGNVVLVARPSSSAVACWFTTLTNTSTVFVPAGGFATQYPTCGAYSPPGAYIVTISGTSGSLNHSVTLPITVMDYSISAQSVTFNAGSSGTSTVTLTSLFGLSGPISLAVSTPSGLTSTCPSSVTLASGGTSTASCAFSSTTQGTYGATITGTFVCSDCYYNGKDIHSTNITVTVSGTAVPDFSVTANPSSLTLTPGSSGTSAITIAPINGFSGTVSLTATHSNGIGAVINPSSITGSGTATLTIGANTTGTFSVQVIGTSGAISHSVIVSVTVANIGVVCIIPSGATSCPTSPASLTGAAGTQLRISVFIQGSGGLNAFDVTLLSDQTILKPAGVDLTGTVLPGPQSVLLECLSGRLVLGNTCSSTDTIDTLHLAAASAPGTITTTPTTGLLFTAIYNVTGTTSGIPLRFQSGCTNTSVSPSICVNIANGTPSPVPETVQTATFSNSISQPDFSIAASPSILALGCAGSATASVTLSSTNGFSGTVTLTLSVVPTGISASINPTTVTLTVGGSATSTLTVSLNGAAPGTYQVRVTGTSGTLTHSTVVIVNVNGSQCLGMTALPNNITMIAGQTGTSTIRIAPFNGFTGTVVLSATSPPGLSVSLNPTSVFLGGAATSLLTISSTSSTPLGNYSLTITGTSGSISSFTGVRVTVIGAPDFTITATPTTQTIGRGSSAAFTITVRGMNGFNGTVTLSTTISPVVRNGPQVSLPSTVGPYSNSTLTMSPIQHTPTGTYTITVTATSGSLTHKVTIKLVMTDNDQIGQH